MSALERIKAIEEELAKTPVNKGTNRHIGVLRARIAKLKQQEQDRVTRGQGQRGDGYTVRKDGDSTVVLLGLPSVGKSTLLNHLTNSNSKVGAYDFTTLTVIPGILKYGGANIQILDIPGIIRGASHGKGLGKRILSATRSADLILVLIDVFNPKMRGMLLNEIRSIGLRPDEDPPNIIIEKRASGGIFITDMVGMTQMEHEGIKDILREYRYHNSRVVIKEDVSYDQFVDTLLKNTVYVPTLTVLNKIDMVDNEYVEELEESLDHYVIPISADNDVNLERLKKEIFEHLNIIRIYMKPRREKADMEEPMIVRNGSTVGDIASMVHGDLRKRLRYSRIWGKSVKFGGQKVAAKHVPMDEDILTFYA